ncbi:F-box/kelch-repeat protein [Ananas comosus]|uniref:F-box/kelch-repeat protein n=1 Tax=Ananas comosus TaxID=4615 RepID=A0A199URK1_ANACO|nr:F-box/kelch-repeat protein [Ananas comosus]
MAAGDSPNNKSGQTDGGEAPPAAAAACSAVPAAEWERLGWDLTELILCRLPLRSLVRAGAVCRQWRAVVARCPPSTWSSSRRRLPWLFVFAHHNLVPRLSSAFAYDPSDEESAWIPLPAPSAPLPDSFSGSGASPSPSSPPPLPPLPLPSPPPPDHLPLPSPRLPPLQPPRRLRPQLRPRKAQRRRRRGRAGRRRTRRHRGSAPRRDLRGRGRRVGARPPSPRRVPPGVLLPVALRRSPPRPRPPLRPRHLLRRALRLRPRPPRLDPPRPLRPRAPGPPPLFAFLAAARGRLVLAGLRSGPDYGPAQFAIWAVDDAAMECEELGAMPAELLAWLFDGEGAAAAAADDDDDDDRFASLKCAGVDGVVYVFNEDRHRGFPACVCEISEDDDAPGGLRCAWRKVPPLPAPVDPFHKVIAFCSPVAVHPVLAPRGPVVR